MKISVVINTYNAEEYLDKVLKSVAGFDEILICDMHSTDKTLEIANKYNCRIIYHERTGIVEPARAYAISQAIYEWVLVVDADEYVPVALKEFLYQQIKKENPPTGILIPRKNFLLGRFMHSAYPDHILRFFKKDRVEWPSRIHAKPIIDGDIYTIPAKRKDLAFIHFSNENISLTINKMNKYTEFEKERRKDRQYGYLDIIFQPFVRFLRFYLFKGGFRDGIPGLIWACEYAYYKFITVAKVIEEHTNTEDYDKDLKAGE